MIQTNFNLRPSEVANKLCMFFKFQFKFQIEILNFLTKLFYINYKRPVSDQTQGFNIKLKGLYNEN
jgi:hypothetical protein